MPPPPRATLAEAAAQGVVRGGATFSNSLPNVTFLGDVAATPRLGLASAAPAPPPLSVAPAAANAAAAPKDGAPAARSAAAAAPKDGAPALGRASPPPLSVASAAANAAAAPKDGAPAARSAAAAAPKDGAPAPPLDAMAAAAAADVPTCARLGRFPRRATPPLRGVSPAPSWVFPSPELSGTLAGATPRPRWCSPRHFPQYTWTFSPDSTVVWHS